ncbi:hypothetical protein B0T10DRAFT_465892 [Thelonectria olida]|uniref:Uncharacterized protein n=1 Tax=Thelonectria olida TaxID=1576542 RepID=A0A9P8VUR7_9HYPO|nr:hypothetical protein B0T10DRAFT_465892 [Thelonectria olida]
MIWQNTSFSGQRTCAPTVSRRPQNPRRPKKRDKREELLPVNQRRYLKEARPRRNLRFGSQHPFQPSTNTAAGAQEVLDRGDSSSHEQGLSKNVKKKGKKASAKTSDAPKALPGKALGKEITDTASSTTASLVARDARIGKNTAQQKAKKENMQNQPEKMYQWLKASRVSPRHNEHPFIKPRLAIPTLASRMPSLYTPGQTICCCTACNADRGPLYPTPPLFTQLNAIWSKANGMLTLFFWEGVQAARPGHGGTENYETCLSVQSNWGLREASLGLFVSWDLLHCKLKRWKTMNLSSTTDLRISIHTPLRWLSLLWLQKGF